VYFVVKKIFFNTPNGGQKTKERELFGVRDEEVTGDINFYR
jgi:hypothetical protein